MNRFCFLLLVVLFSSAKLILERATFRWVSIMCINYEPLITVSSYKRDPHRFFFLRRTFSIERKKTPGEVRCARDAAGESMFSDLDHGAMTRPSLRASSPTFAKIRRRSSLDWSGKRLTMYTLCIYYIINSSGDMMSLLYWRYL
jgi:hypothetical protein